MKDCLPFIHHSSFITHHFFSDLRTPTLQLRGLDVMSKILRPSLILILLLLAVTSAHAQDRRDSGTSAQAGPALTGSILPPSGDDVKKEDRAGAPGPSTARPADPAIADPLVRVLLAKGVITPEEARAVAVAVAPAEQRDRLAALLRDKGLISDAEYEAVRAAPPSGDVARAAAASPVQAGAQKAEAQKPAPAPAPSVIAAGAPPRLLQVYPPKREGLIPDINISSGARPKPYRFFKTMRIKDPPFPA